MKFFICPFDKDSGVFLGVPAASAAGVLSLAALLEAAEAGAPAPVRISLPALLGRPDLPCFHGILLKDRLPQVVLLVPPIDTDEDIPEESIVPLPGPLKERLPLIGGICFGGEDRLILLIEPGVAPGKSGGPERGDKP
ncbi:MAG: hypothetical protein LBQ44_09065 [Treponema sp.]|jgi:hypothetical protein|nr:hypothetical protein [Treponema sp.]